MDVLRKALQQQQCTPELLELLSLARPQPQQWILLNTQGLSQDTQHYQKLISAFHAFGTLLLNQTAMVTPSLSQRMKIEFDALQEIAAGFNYAFDAYWLLPLARSIYTHLVRRAIQMDKQLKAQHQRMDKVKAVCVPLDNLRAKMMDRLSFPQTKKAGILFTLNLIFQCYLQLNSLKQMQKVHDYVFHHVLPDPTAVEKYFSKSDQVTFHYYMGVFLLIQHNIEAAAEHLSKAYTLCPANASGNKQRIALYWIAANVIQGQFPASSSSLWQKHPDLYQFFMPLRQAVLKGHMGNLHVYLKQFAPILRRLHLEHVFQVRLPCLVYRNLVRRVFVVGSQIYGCTTFGYTQDEADASMGMDTQQDGSPALKTPAPRIALDHLCLAWKLSGDPSYPSSAITSTPRFSWNRNQEGLDQNVLNDMLFMLGRLIDAGLIKGHVLPFNQCMVLSRKQPFPALSVVMPRLMAAEQWWAPIATDRRIVEGEANEDD